MQAANPFLAFRWLGGPEGKSVVAEVYPSLWTRRLGLLHWRQELDWNWNTVDFGTVRVETRDGQHFFQVQVSLGTLNPDQIKVELYANSAHGGKPAVESIIAPESSADSPGVFTYSAQVSATRASSDYTARITPHHTNASVPLEAGQILWQH